MKGILNTNSEFCNVMLEGRRKSKRLKCSLILFSYEFSVDLMLLKGRRDLHCLVDYAGQARKCFCICPIKFICIWQDLIIKRPKKRSFEIVHCLRWERNSYEKCRSDKIVFPHRFNIAKIWLFV